jgi:serine protease Do
MALRSSFFSSSVLAGTALALLLPAVAGTLPASSAQAAESRASVTAGFADLVEKLSPAVVNISTSQKVKAAQGYVGSPFPVLPNTPDMEPFRDFFERFGQPMPQGPAREVYSLGSGFIVEASGYIITNNHVVEEADEISVTLPDNTKYKATLIGRDPKTDLALLKIDAEKPLPFVSFGDSDAMRVGDWVIAIGNPFGLGGSVTQGIISARQRSINAGPFDDFLQTDAPINRGNSGGPLFNTKGEVIGINSAIFSPTGGSVGIGFAIPSSLAKPIIAQLKEFGRTHRGWLGVKIQEVSDEIADSLGLKKAKGALILEVSPDGPAGKGGIQSGDVITAFDGKEVSQMRHLPRMVAETKIGKTVNVTFWRGGSSKTTQITLGEQDETAIAEENKTRKSKKDGGKAESGNPVVQGMELAPLTPQLRAQLRLPAGSTGLVVLEVNPSSDAARRGVRAGDVLVDVGGASVNSVADINAHIALARKAGRKFVLVKLARGEELGFITLPTTEEKAVDKN